MFENDRAERIRFHTHIQFPVCLKVGTFSLSCIWGPITAELLVCRSENLRIVGNFCSNATKTHFCCTTDDKTMHNLLLILLLAFSVVNISIWLCFHNKKGLESNLMVYEMHTETVQPALHPCFPSPFNCTLWCVFSSPKRCQTPQA